MNEKFNYFVVNGYTSTGSSAVIDLLMEYKGVYAPDKEFRLIKDPNGIIELDRALNNSIDMLNEDIAAKKFLNFAKMYYRKGKFNVGMGQNYKESFGKKFYDLCVEYIRSLSTFEYQGYWWYFDIDKTRCKYFFDRLLKKIGIRDYRDKTKMFLFSRSEYEFCSITKEFIDKIFYEMCLEKRIDAKNIVLDQGVPGAYPLYAERYLSSSKVIIVERDPRDVYIDLITEKAIVGHVGHDVSKTHNVDLFIEWYKKNRQYGKTIGNQLKVQFEDLILNYESEVKRIEAFLGLKSEEHILKKEYLKPEKSMKNVGYWKNYPYQDEIKKIEIELESYLWNNK